MLNEIGFIVLCADACTIYKFYSNLNIIYHIQVLYN